jgi:hypothetical protein
VFWNEGPHGKLRGITELKPSELPEIFGGGIRGGSVWIWEAGCEGSSIIIHEHSVLVHCQQRRD